MESSLADFSDTIKTVDPCLLHFEKLEILQVNLGNRCNQSCRHCHVKAGPDGRNIMSRKSMDKLISFLEKHPGLTLDITGGAPELHPDFNYFVEKTDGLTLRRLVRTNLTIMTEPGMDWLPEFYRDHDIILAASLPCTTRDNVDRQRGRGVFDRSLSALKMLNAVGYGKAHELNLVYNPDGDSLPPSQKELERKYRQHLSESYGMHFNSLLTITNTPIGRFGQSLMKDNRYESYIEMLSRHFNPDAAGKIMCRTLVSVDWQGLLYNCDFNQAQGFPIRNSEKRALTVDDLESLISDPPEIITDVHCFSCTAGAGSSCSGELAPSGQDAHSDVQKYYGEVLQSSRDLKTSACCSTESLPDYQRRILKKIAPEVLDRFYGCGSPIPLCLDGCTLLDLGCGTGRDAFTAACLAGPDGFVIGVDMTGEQLKIGRRNVRRQMESFGFSKPNIVFRHGYIEDLKRLGIRSDSVDVVISNCVINLSPDKHAVFNEILRVLKPGGELFFADVFAGRRVPEALSADPLLRGECLGGALYIEDFRRLMRDLGCLDSRVFSKRSIQLNSPEILQKVGMIDFFSMTVRVFKLEGLEDICEDYGQVATYLGTIPESPHCFILDDHHCFETGKPAAVCGNTAAMLGQTRYAKHFRITGSTDTHYGPFGFSTETNDSGQGGPVHGGGCC